MRNFIYKSIIFSLFFSVLFGLFLYSSNSPLGASYGSDNSMYLTMGTALKNGYRPYLDIFDHKGPFLFLIQLLPQLFSSGYSTTAVFIQEVIFLFFSLCILGFLSVRYLGMNSPLWIQLIYLAAISSLVSGGNLCEEYSNLFLIISIFFALRYENDVEKNKVWSSFIPIGACFAISFLTRANNGLPIAFFFLGFLIDNKSLSSLFKMILAFSIGAVIVSFPIFIWLISHRALNASFQASILHNFLYSETVGPYVNGRLKQLLTTDYGLFSILLFFFSFAGALCIRKKSPAFSISMILSAAGSGIAAYISHKYYLHYLILGVPMSVIGIILIISTVPSKYAKPAIMFSTFFCIIWTIYQGFIANQLRIQDRFGIVQYIEDAKKLTSQIPKEDQSSVYPYRVEPKWYVVADILPSYKYYFLQEILAESNPKIMDEIVDYFNKTPPKWVVIFNNNREFSPPYDTRIQEIFNKLYTTVDSAGDYQLLHLNPLV